VKFRSLPRILKNDGWEIDRTRGSRSQLVHPTKPGALTGSCHAGDYVHPKTLKGVLRQPKLEGDS
jgi:predicted RNA binding protein YcfA (HicA-like mRNA interferase family)